MNPLISIGLASLLSLTPPPFRGINLAGAEFAPETIPGKEGTNYVWPSDSELDFYAKEGANTIRLPFSWERLQPQLNGEFDRAYLASLDHLVQRATRRNRLSVVLDPHNYARYRGELIGTPEVPRSAFSDLWRRLSVRYQGNAAVLFGLMNEPHSMSTESWARAAQEAIDAIRMTGAKNWILVPGNAWSGAHSWLQNWYGTPNAVAMGKIVDPLSRFAFDVHQYFDSDSSGNGPTCESATIGSKRLDAFTSWAASRGALAFLGEFGVPETSVCLKALEDTLKYVTTHRQVWIGYAYWAGGPWWGSYPLSVEPPGAEKRRSVLRPYWRGRRPLLAKPGSEPQV